MAVTTDQLHMKFGITQAFECSYLTEQQEQLLVYVDETQEIQTQYEWLIVSGFRRSGEQIYRPHCPQCNACQSIRIRSHDFKPSRSQKRVLNKNNSLQMVYQSDVQENYYGLYEKYIVERHRDGSMYPPSQSQFSNFVGCSWNRALFVEAWDNDTLVAVSVVDELESALSALYTFFDPEYAHRSMGSFMILQLISYASRLGKPFVYLGYQIDACKKMNYKQNFYPHERFYHNKWHLKVKNSD